MAIDKAALIRIGVTAGALFAAYKFAPNATVKAMVLGAAGVAIIRNTPVVNNYVAV
jgi:ABC-type amino acid transport system permease subunit